MHWEHAACAHAALIMPVCRAYSKSPPASTTGPACSTRLAPGQAQAMRQITSRRLRQTLADRFHMNLKSQYTLVMIQISIVQMTKAWQHCSAGPASTVLSRSFPKLPSTETNPL